MTFHSRLHLSKYVNSVPASVVGKLVLVVAIADPLKSLPIAVASALWLVMDILVILGVVAYGA